MNRYADDALADQLTQTARTHRVQVESIDCVWREWGRPDGPTIVFVHGGTGSWLHWVRNIAVFAENYRVLVPDMAGYGDSGDAPTGLGAAGQARLLLEVLSHLVGPTEQFIFVGFSFGAVVCGMAAVQAPDRVRGLLLVGAVGLGIERRPPARLRAWKHLDDRFEIERAHRHNLRVLMLASDESVDPLAMTVQRHNAHAARFFSKRSSHSSSLAKALAELQIPVAGIWGSQDVTADCDFASVESAVRALCPSAKLQQIEGAGHWVQFEAALSFNDQASALCAGFVA